FKATFDQTPSESRNDVRREYHVRTGNGVHFFTGTRPIALLPIDIAELKMEVNILENCEPRRLACVPHIGAYHLISSAFEKLGGFATQHQLWGGAMVAVYYDSPELTPENALRSAAGVQLVDERSVPEGLEEVHIGGGKWACYRHVGPYSGLGDAWNKFSKWLLQNGQEFGMEPAYEVYVNDCRQVPPEEVLTDLYIKIQ
ncbi:MAG: hypothetical protein CBB60_002530, partial [Armatimonadetes bacterium Cent15-Ar3]